MKKTCNGCKADSREHTCMLGYKCKNGVPQAECPKPKSWKQFNRIKKELKKEQANE